ncbi:30S ribosomal protein S20 [Patescibacteria group bacterium]
MPNIKSAKKALRQSKTRRLRNIKRKDEIKKTVKEIKKLVTAKKSKEALKLVPKAYKAIDKAAKRGIIKKNAASRKKSRLVKFIKSSK